MAFDPDAQLDNWYGWLGTQTAHAAVVGNAAAFIFFPLIGPMWAPIITAAIYLVGWEIKKQRLGAGWKDALEDTACVMAGGSILCGMSVGYLTALVCFAAWAFFLLVGVLRRA